MIYHQSIPLALKVLVVAVLYVSFGKLSLLLAVAPGFATAVFLPAGIALGLVQLWGYRVSIGVLIGSFLLNSMTAWDVNPVISLNSSLVALGIGTGATLQACYCVWLVRRFVGEDMLLANERDVFLFLVYAGPIGCFISPTLGVFSLLLGGQMPVEESLYSWWNWWVGDSIGVFIAAPLVFIALANPRKLWRPRLKSVALPLLVGSSLVVMVFVQVSMTEQTRIREKFDAQAQTMLDAVTSRFDLLLQHLDSLQKSFSVNSSLSREDFNYIVQPTLDSYPGIQAFGWLPVISKERRADYEKNVRESGHEGFVIRERGSGGKLIAAKEREYYVPVHYILPHKGNETAFGFDIASSVKRGEALRTSRDLNTVAMSAPIRLVQENEQQIGMLMSRPVFAKDNSDEVFPAVRDMPVAFVSGVFRFGDLLDAAFVPFERNYFSLKLVDITSEQDPYIVHHDNSKPLMANRFPVQWQQRFQLANRYFLATFSATDAYVQSNRSLNSWFVLAGGLLFCSLLGGFLLIISGRQQQIDELVSRKTGELQSILSHAVEGILILNEDGIIESINPAALRLFGFSEKELLDEHISRLMPDMRNIGEFYAEGKNFHAQVGGLIGQTKEVFGINAAAEKVAVEIGISVVEVSDKRLFTCMIHDIRERKKTEKMKSEFISMVSHELRTPVTSIVGALGLIANETEPLLPKTKSLVDMASNNAQRLGNLINDMLDVERLEFGQIKFDMKTDSIKPMVERAIMANKGYADSYGIELAFLSEDIQESKCFVKVDQKRLQQVMSNLLSNAVKFSKPGGRVEIEIEQGDAEVSVLVHDNGVGMTKDFQFRVFEKTASHDTARHTEGNSANGTGLGLTIVKAIIEKMNGNVGFESVAEKGTTFFFVLPRAHPAFTVLGRNSQNKL